MVIVVLLSLRLDISEDFMAACGCAEMFSGNDQLTARPLKPKCMNNKLFLPAWQ